jgi:hypothetical protein
MAKAATKKAAKKTAPPTKATKQSATETIATQPPDSIITIAENKGLKAKEKVVQISSLVLNNKVFIDELVQTAASQKVL